MRVFVFDGDCAFCSSANRLMLRMTKGRIESRPYQHLELEKLGITLLQAQTAVQYLTPLNRFSGARAIAEYLVDSKTIWSVAGRLMRLAVVISFAELIYELVSKNRHRLPGGTPECELPRR